MSKLNVKIDLEGFSFEEAKDGEYQELEGGLGRIRSDFQEASYIVSVVWTIGPNDFETLNIFYENNEHLMFQIDLAIDYSYPVEYNAYFIPGTFGLNKIDGNTYVVAAQLEVLQNEHDVDLDNWYLASYAIYPDFNAGNVFKLLSELVNENLPGIG